VVPVVCGVPSGDGDGDGADAAVGHRAHDGFAEDQQPGQRDDDGQAGERDGSPGGAHGHGDRFGHRLAGAAFAAEPGDDEQAVVDGQAHPEHGDHVDREAGHVGDGADREQDREGAGDCSEREGEADGGADGASQRDAEQDQDEDQGDGFGADQVAFGGVPELEVDDRVAAENHPIVAKLAEPVAQCFDGGVFGVVGQPGADADDEQCAAGAGWWELAVGGAADLMHSRHGAQLVG